MKLSPCTNMPKNLPASGPVIPPIKTSEKYLNALEMLQNILQNPEASRLFIMSDFIKAQKLSFQFVPACIGIGIISPCGRWRGTHRIRYKWNITIDVTPDHAQMIRENISRLTNGNAPKHERSESGGGNARPKVERRRNTAQNGSHGHPRTGGMIDRNKTIEEIKSSFFHKLCPNCAETLRQIIEIIKS